MIVLAIDTTHDFGSLAILYGSELLEESLLHAPEGFSSILFPQVQALLKRNDLGIDEVDVFAAAAGPGSFTGVRIGLSAAKGLAEAHQKQCFAVSNLAAMANFGSAPVRAAVLDARRGEVYGGVFGDHPSTEIVAPFGRWLEMLPQQTSEFLAFDFAPFEAALSSSPFAHATHTTVPRAIASSVAELALERFRVGENGDPALLDANYVRRSDAELLWKDRS
jgi:tRNA threonylcarbamoyladenosine biosynthesis protein TsaB